MVKAVWNGEVIAESDATILIEGNHYFPRDAVRDEFLKPSSHTSYCPWKGTAQYFTLSAGGTENPNAAWCYPETLPKADPFRGYVAFWKGVTIS